MAEARRRSKEMSDVVHSIVNQDLVSPKIPKITPKVINTLPDNTTTLQLPFLKY
jgi:hypothetical protein